MDNETEAAIQRSLERITTNRTTVVIAHRLCTIRNADCIKDNRTYAKIVQKLNLSNRQDAFAQRLVREERQEFVECA